jgi:hypothetical protein
MSLFEKYRRAGQRERARIIKNAGFTTEEEYLTKIGGAFVRKRRGSNKIANPSPKSETSGIGFKPIIHNVHILDASGSMQGEKLRNAIEGINSEIRELQRDENALYTQTLVDFSDDVRTVYYKTPIAQVKTYNIEDRSTTALYDAIGQTLTRLIADTNEVDKVLIKIFTDRQRLSLRSLKAA